MEVISLTKQEQEYLSGKQVGLFLEYLRNDGNLYLVDGEKKIAYKLPERYKNTPVFAGQYTGDYDEKNGLIKVSLMHYFDLHYHRQFGEIGGLWGWINLDGEEVIKPEYAYVSRFENGLVTVCKADEWYEVEPGRYWCENEKWGVIDETGKEVIPFLYDEILFFDNIYHEDAGTKFFRAHVGGWENGSDCILDDKGEVVLMLDFELDRDYTFPMNLYLGEYIVLEVIDFSIEDDEIVEVEEEDYRTTNDERIYIYDLKKKEWIAYYDRYVVRKVGENKQIFRLRDGVEEFMLEMPEEWVR